MSEDSGNDDDKSDSEIIEECAVEMHRMQEKSVGGKRLREISEESSEEGFITVTRSRKPKRLIRSDSLSADKPIEDIEHEGSCEKIEVCLTSAEMLPKQMALAKILRNEQINNIIRIHYKNPFKVFIQFSDKKQAESLINCQKLEQLGVRTQFTSGLTFSFGIVKGVDLDISEEEFLDTLTSSCEILSVKRLKRLDSEGNWINSETIRIGFKNRSRPTFVYAYGCRFPVERYTFPVNQCSNCWKFGHMKRFCPSKNIVCPKCSKHHMNCETVTFSCPNCKGPHMALDKSCTAYLREKKIRLIMGDKDLSYKEAYEDYLRSNKEIRNNNIDDTNTAYVRETMTASDQCQTTTSQTHPNIIVNISEQPTSVNQQNSQRKEIEAECPHSGKNGNIAKKGRKKQNNQNSEILTMEIDNEASGTTEAEQLPTKDDSKKEEREERRKKMKSLMRKIEEVIICETFTIFEKIIMLIKIIYEECKSYFVNMFCGRGALRSLFNLFDG